MLDLLITNATIVDGSGAASLEGLIPMSRPQTHVLVADVGGTHIGLAIIAYLGDGKFEPVSHQNFLSRKTKNFPALIRRSVTSDTGGLVPAVCQARIDLARPFGA